MKTTALDFTPVEPIKFALPMFLRELQRGWLFRFWARLTHAETRLLDLEDMACCAGVQEQSYAGMRPVEINQIRGSLGKSGEFDARFHPLSEASRSRWLSVAVQRLRGRDLPPVDLVEVNGIYYVRDGHHRISVARSLGQNYIDAEIMHLSLGRVNVH